MSAVAALHSTPKVRFSDPLTSISPLSLVTTVAAAASRHPSILRHSPLEGRVSPIILSEERLFERAAYLLDKIEELSLSHFLISKDEEQVAILLAEVDSLLSVSHIDCFDRLKIANAGFLLASLVGLPAKSYIDRSLELLEGRRSCSDLRAFLTARSHAVFTKPDAVVLSYIQLLHLLGEEMGPDFAQYCLDRAIYYYRGAGMPLMHLFIERIKPEEFSLPSHIAECTALVAESMKRIPEEALSYARKSVLYSKSLSDEELGFVRVPLIGPYLRLITHYRTKGEFEEALTILDSLEMLLTEEKQRDILIVGWVSYYIERGLLRCNRGEFETGVDSLLELFKAPDTSVILTIKQAAWTYIVSQIAHPEFKETFIRKGGPDILEQYLSWREEEEVWFFASLKERRAAADLKKFYGEICKRLSVIDNIPAEYRDLLAKAKEYLQKIGFDYLTFCMEERLYTEAGACLSRKEWQDLPADDPYKEKIEGIRTSLSGHSLEEATLSGRKRKRFEVDEDVSKPLFQSVITDFDRLFYLSGYYTTLERGSAAHMNAASRVIDLMVELGPEVINGRPIIVDNCFLDMILYNKSVKDYARCLYLYHVLLQICEEVGFYPGSPETRAIITWQMGSVHQLLQYPFAAFCIWLEVMSDEGADEWKESAIDEMVLLVEDSHFDPSLYTIPEELLAQFDLFSQAAIARLSAKWEADAREEDESFCRLGGQTIEKMKKYISFVGISSQTLLRFIASAFTITVRNVQWYIRHEKYAKAEEVITTCLSMYGLSSEQRERLKELLKICVEKLYLV